jgi:topoisomerase-4 subunit B
MAETVNYDDDSIKSLDWKEHIRLRPNMYIGKLGDGTAYDDGIYVLLRNISHILWQYFETQSTWKPAKGLE